MMLVPNELEMFLVQQILHNYINILCTLYSVHSLLNIFTCLYNHLMSFNCSLYLCTISIIPLGLISAIFDLSTQYHLGFL